MCFGFSVKQVSAEVRSVWSRKEFTKKAFNLVTVFQCNF